MTNKLIKNESNNLTEQKEFQPTPGMIVWLDKALELMTDNISEIERASNITAQTWYYWLKNDNFRLWFKTEWDKRLSGESWKLDAVGMKRARQDFKYWEGMQRRVGNLQEAVAPINAIQNNVIIEKRREYDI